jgi:hypothetical protein
MCWLAKGLIAACVGYLPSPGETVTVKRACISNYSKLTRGAASACAHEHKIKYRVDAQVMFEGMIRGSFTGKRLSDFFNDAKTDWPNARKIINGLDRAEMIASYARQFHGALIAASAPVKQPVPDVPAPIKPPAKPKSNAGPVGTVIVAGGAAAAAAHKQGCPHRQS